MNQAVKVILILLFIGLGIGLLNSLMGTIDLSIVDNTITWIFSVFAQTNGILPVIKIDQDILILLQVFSASLTTLIVAYLIKKLS